MVISVPGIGHFGDGNTGTDPSPNHSYVDAGNYPIHVYYFQSWLPGQHRRCYPCNSLNSG